MEFKQKKLEELSKEFFDLKIKGKFENQGFNPIEVEGVERYIPAINYLLGIGYLVEGKGFFSESLTVASVRYFPTKDYKDWALNENKKLY